MREHEDNLIFGTRAVLEAVKAGKELDKILVQKGIANELFDELRQALFVAGIQYQFVPAEKLKRMSSKNHQGVIGFLSQITYYDVADILAATFEKGKAPLVLILDRITDVRNFGAITRSAACSGVDMIIIPSRGSAQINADAVKTSAGALHHIPVCKENNLKNTLDYLKESGLQIVCCHEKTDKLIYDVDFTIPTAIIMGSEEDGISAEYIRKADTAVKIPMVGNIASLNVSVACGIVLFEAVRQRV